ncbi:MAG: hypothetical protein DDT34_02090 [Firmicutes bacterium]|nr:hypothetical protein [Bacillota bacterium]
MLRAVKVVVGIALVLIIVAAIVFVGIPMVESKYIWVVVAQVNLSPGMRVGDGLVGLRMLAADAVPKGALHTLEGIREMYALENITRGEVVLHSNLTTVTPPPDRSVPRQGHVLAGVVASPADVAGLFVGDRVDVMIVRLRVDADGELVKNTIGAPVKMETRAVKGWLVHSIEYGDAPIWETELVSVVLEVKYDEFRAAWGYPRGHPKHATNPDLPQLFPSRMVRSVPISD